MRITAAKATSLRGTRSTGLCNYEELERPLAAIAREKQIKAWTRKKRIDLINAMNPKWIDLAADWYGPGDLD